MKKSTPPAAGPLSSPIGAAKKRKKRAGITRKMAAEIVGISTTTIDRARRGKRYAIPELCAAVEANRVKLGAADILCRLPSDDQAVLVNLGPHVMRDVAAEIRTALKANKDIASEPPAGALEICRRAMVTLERIPDDDDDLHEGLRRVIEYCEARRPDGEY